VLRVGNLELDPATRVCRRGRSPVTLTAKEFGVLEFLLRHRDRVVTKNEIIAGVWDDARDPDPNLVEVYISSLRRKVDTPFGQRNITTVRGVGYRLCDGWDGPR
jgi:DNA-binding response OmpR family regulator